MTLVEVLLRRRIKHRTSSDGRVHLCCPFCTERGKPTDEKFRLCVHAVQGWCRCMHCGYKRRQGVFSVLKQLGITETVAGFERHVPSLQSPPELPKDFQCLDRAYDDLDKQAQKYVIDRGVTKKQITHERIGTSFVGRYAYRILFPVWMDQHNTPTNTATGAKILKGINARDFTGQSKIKYLNSEGDKYLYHFNSQATSCVLSEGVFKCLRIAQVTEDCSSALLGHDLTETQAKQLEESQCENVILFPDKDLVGLRGMIKVADQITHLGRRIRIRFAYPVVLPADEAPLAQIRDLLQNAVPDSFTIRQRIRS